METFSIFTGSKSFVMRYARGAATRPAAWMAGCSCDVMRAVASEFDAEHHQVGAFMTSDPTTIGPEADIHEGLSSMFAFGFRHMPVVEGGQVVGMVSMRDLMEHLLDPADRRISTLPPEPFHGERRLDVGYG